MLFRSDSTHELVPSSLDFELPEGRNVLSLLGTQWESEEHLLREALSEWRLQAGELFWVLLFSHK